MTKSPEQPHIDDLKRLLSALTGNDPQINDIVQKAMNLLKSITQLVKHTDIPVRLKHYIALIVYSDIFYEGSPKDVSENRMLENLSNQLRYDNEMVINRLSRLHVEHILNSDKFVTNAKVKEILEIIKEAAVRGGKHV